MVVDVCTRTKYGYSLVIFIFVPPTLMHGFRKTASQIAMKVRVYIYNYISEIR